MIPDDPITSLDACGLSEAIRKREVSCRATMTAYLNRIDALNPSYNAIVSLRPRADLIQAADERDVQLGRGERLGWLHGFPLAIKDLASTRDVATSLGSPLFAGDRPAHDSWTVERMKSAGGIVVGKTNTPEFGLGSHTFNSVFGATCNAWDRGRSAGGSSGGAAVSLTLRLQPVADGSDMMGSLRNPAAFANVFGLRPSSGRVPSGPLGDQFVSQLSTDGPMGRRVRDVARLLAVQAGHESRAPLSLADSAIRFEDAAGGHIGKPRIGWLADLNGYLAVEPGILDVCEQGLARFESLGARVEPAVLGHPPAQVWRIWLAWRHWLVAGRLAALYADPAKRRLLKPEAVWEVERGLALSAADVYEASVERSLFYRHLVALFERFDFLALPSAQVWPFAIDERWPAVIAGRAMDTYHRWMEVVIYASLGGLPAISLPVGFNDDGLPMGMQLIGRPQADFEVLRAAAAYEQTIGELLAREPPLGTG